MKHTLSLIVLLGLLWWVLSGYTKPLLLSLGVASVLLTVFIARRMDVVDEESHPLELSPRLIPYWGRLIKEIAVSNIQVIKLILSPKPDIDPSIFTVTTDQKSDLSKVVLGNSITLTPGTVTLDIRGDQIEVHALTREAAEDVLAGSLDKRVPGTHRRTS